MKHQPASLRTLWQGSLVALLVVQVGCSHSPPTASAGARTSSAGRQLTPTEAARLAAQLANDECHRVYRRRPFTPDRYPATLTNDGYRWGRLDVGAPGGLSAVVMFAPDGSKPTVEVYFSTDILRPRALTVDPYR